MKIRLPFVLLILFLDLCCFAVQAKVVTVTGRIIDYKAEPVADVAVVAYKIFRELGQSNLELVGGTRNSIDGRFSFEVQTQVIDNRLLLVAYKQGLALGWKKFGRADECTILLGKPSLFRGIVVDETGNPVPGAKLRMCLSNEMMSGREFAIAPSVPEDWFTARTDERGQFIFDNVPPGTTADFYVEASGRASVWTICDYGLAEGERFAAGSTDIRIALPPEACIEGKVLNENTGEEIPDVRIEAKPAGHSRWRFNRNPVYSDPNGKFLFTGLKPQTQQLVLMSPKEKAWKLSMNIEPEQMVCDIKVPLDTGVPFEVKVYDPIDEEPIENGQVTVTQTENSSRYITFEQTATTGSDGVSRFRIPPGECEVRVIKPGYGFTFQPQSIQIETGQTQRHEVALTRTACILSGKVVDERGNLLSGALVIDHGMGSFLSDFTDDEGRFEVSYHRGHPGSRERVIARHAKSGLAGSGVLRYSEQSGRYNGRIVLEPAYTLTGRVTDPSGKGIPAANVKLLLSVGEKSTIQVMGAHSRPVTEVTTDADGVYCIRSVQPPGDGPKDAYAVLAYAEGFGLAMVNQIPFGDDINEPVHLEPIVLQPADKVLSGVVKDPSGQPVNGIYVRLYGQRLGSGYGKPICGRTITDEQGRFRFEGVCDELYDVYATSPWGEKHMGLTVAYGGSENVKVILAKEPQLVPSLIGRYLPELKDLKIELSESDTNNKKMLVCFFDMNQRPSRNCLKELAERAKELKKKNISVVAVQASEVEKQKLDEWIKENNIPFPVGIITADIEKTLFAWGVRSLPWLILTDKQHVVTAGGITLDELNEKIGN